VDGSVGEKTDLSAGRMITESVTSKDQGRGNLFKLGEKKGGRRNGQEWRAVKKLQANRGRKGVERYRPAVALKRKDEGGREVGYGGRGRAVGNPRNERASENSSGSGWSNSSADGWEGKFGGGKKDVQRVSFEIGKKPGQDYEIKGNGERDPEGKGGQ